MTADRRDLAAWIMDRAVRKPPAGREDWAQAMRAEFEALEKGRLSWSLGCLAAAARWRAPGEAAYTAALAVGVACVGASPLILFGLMFAGLVTRPQMALAVMPFIIATPVLASFAIAMNWPGRRLATALVVGLGPSVIGNLMLVLAGVGLRVPSWRMLLAWATLVGLGYVGALMGAALGRRRAARIA